jgi:hypothetical protein
MSRVIKSWIKRRRQILINGPKLKWSHLDNRSAMADDTRGWKKGKRRDTECKRESNESAHIARNRASPDRMCGLTLTLKDTTQSGDLKETIAIEHALHKGGIS